MDIKELTHQIEELLIMVDGVPTEVYQKLKQIRELENETVPYTVMRQAS